MAIEYSLEAQTSLTPSEALRLLSHELHAPFVDDKRLNRPDVIFIYVAASRPSLIEEHFGFTSTLSIYFRLDKFDGYDEGLNLTIHGTMSVLMQSTQQAVLLFNGENIVLQYQNGELTLNSDFYDYANHQQTLSEITLPYVIKKLHSPLL